MKHPRYFLIPAAVVLTAGFSGCKPESEEETPVKTVFELTQDTVTVAAEGGQASVGYKLEGAQEGKAPLLSMSPPTRRRLRGRQR